MTHSAQEFESERFLEYVRFAVTMINKDGGELETLLPGTLRKGRLAYRMDAEQRSFQRPIDVIPRCIVHFCLWSGWDTRCRSDHYQGTKLNETSGHQHSSRICQAHSTCDRGSGGRLRGFGDQTDQGLPAPPICVVPRPAMRRLFNTLTDATGRVSSSLT